MAREIRRSLRFDRDWYFHPGEVPAPLPNTHLAAYMANKAGWARGASRRNFDDSDWRTVQLPHDWAVEGEFHPDHHVDAGFLPRGTGWYRRHFRLDDADRGRFLAIQFDGVSTRCAVYVNGHLLHRSFSGYTPFTVDISAVATFGDELNVVAVHVDATYMEGWWYEGAGLYRHVWLIVAAPVHIATHGTFIRPERQVDGGWDVHIETVLENTSGEARAVHVVHELFDPSGEALSGCDAGARGTPVQVGAHARAVHRTVTSVSNPPLWSLKSPVLCDARTRLYRDDQLVDEVTTRFGFRTIRFDPSAGFYLNDQPVKLKGTCNHQDHAGVGVAVPDSIHRFRIRRLLEMGCNAYRSAHNPPAAELLDACDELGMLVIDEARNFGADPESIGQLSTMVRRDRNHPSVILWSICNEEAIQGSEVAGRIAARMQDAVRQLDSSRPVTAAVSGGIFNPEGIAGVAEIVGINYQLPLQQRFHDERPMTPLLASETHCVLSTRATYRSDVAGPYFAESGAEVAPWGATAADTWAFIAARPFIAGLFVWTGFDYRGEPTPHAWPCVGSQFGLLDLCGFAKEGFHQHRAYFSESDDEVFAQIAPHWNQPAPVGETVPVVVYTNGDAVELFLNGVSLGRLDVDPIRMVTWQVPYASGELRAVVFRSGDQKAEVIAETTGVPAALQLEVHASAGSDRIPADGRFAIPITVFATDERGRRVPTADNMVSFEIDGPARLIGVGNGDPASHEPNQANSRRLFRGLAQVIVQTDVHAGVITLRAAARGLAIAELQLQSIATAAEPAVDSVCPRYWLQDWRMSPMSRNRPDPHLASMAQDMNSWERVNPSQGLQTRWLDDGGHAIYRSTVTVPKRLRAGGVSIHFSTIVGAVEAFVDGQPVPFARSGDSATVEVIAPAGKVVLTILIAAQKSVAGIGGRVEILPRNVT